METVSRAQEKLRILKESRKHMTWSCSCCEFCCVSIDLREPFKVPFQNPLSKFPQVNALIKVEDDCWTHLLQDIVDAVVLLVEAFHRSEVNAVQQILRIPGLLAPVHAVLPRAHD